MVSWEYFRVKRKLKVIQWMENVGVTTYDDLVRVLRGLGVSPPTEAVAAKWLPKPAPKVVAKLPSVKRPSPKAKVEPQAVPPPRTEPVSVVKPKRKRPSRRKVSEARGSDE